MERNRPLVQRPDAYTAEDHKVWRTLFERQSALLAGHASAEYLAALEEIGFSAGNIPVFETVNLQLRRKTGWQLQVVQGHVPPRDFFESLAQRVFPATCWLRTFAELDYIEEPDMFHDVFGHVPLLLHPGYAAFIQAFGELALQWHDEPGATELLSRIYWFTIEFGIIREAGRDKIYGAGILSSPGETAFSMSEVPTRKPFDTTEVLQTAFRTDAIQEQYFTIGDWSQLNAILPEVHRIMLAQKRQPVPIA